MHPAIIIRIVRSLIVDVAMGQIPRSTERISSFHNECFTTLSLTVFIPSNFVANFLQAKCDFTRKTFCVFEPPLRGLGATYNDHLRLIGKRVVNFLLMLI